MQGIGGYQQGKFRQRLAQRNADQERLDALGAANRIGRQTRREMGLARAGVGPQGTTFAGSPLMVLADLAMEAEDQRLLALAGGESRAASQEAAAEGYGQMASGSLLRGAIGGGIGLGFGIGPPLAAQFPSVGGVTSVAPRGPSAVLTGANRNFAQYAP